MTPPVLAMQQWKFVYHGMGGSAFQLLHQLAHSKIWRNRNEKMNMVGRHMAFEDFHLMFLTGTAYQRPGLLAMSPDKIFFRYLVIQTRCR